MRHRKPTSRGLGPIGLLMMGVVTLVLGGGGTIAGLSAFGVIDLFPTVARQVDRTGQIAFPVPGRPLEPYETITRDDLGSETGAMSVLWLPKDQAPEHAIRDLSKIIGRVMARPKKPNYLFTENDFLPPGTRPGVVAGIPAGKRAMWLDAKKIRGLGQLRVGDRFDLMTTLEIDPAEPQTPELARLQGGIEKRSTAISKDERLSGVRRLVRNGSMVTDAEQAKALAKQLEGSEANSSRNRQEKPPLEITIAIAPEEVAPLTQALASEQDIFCIPRSGRPDDPEEKLPDEIDFENMVAVPVTSQPVKRLARIAEADLADRDTGELKVYYFPKEEVNPEWILDARQIVGRVAARDLGVGYPLSEDDLLPIGSNPGIPGGTPAGKMAMPLPIQQIEGLAALRGGDRFDLISIQSPNLLNRFPQLRLGATGRSVPGMDQLLTELESRSVISVLAENAVVVMEPEGTSEETETSVSLMAALRAEEITPVTKALSQQATMFAIARPSENLSTEASPARRVQIPADDDPVEEFAIIEQVDGSEKRVDFFAAPPAKPAAETAEAKSLQTKASPTEPSRPSILPYPLSRRAAE